MGIFNFAASKWAAFPILFLQFVNTGLLAPTLPDIIVPFFDNSYAAASMAQGICDSAGAFLAFMISPMVGSLSDVYGRRPFLLLTVLITSAQVWAIALYPNISLYYYLVAKAFGKVSVFGPVLSYVADCTTTEDRTPAFGQAMAAIFLALTTGPFISMFTSPALAFRLACACTVINCLYIIFILPESPATLAGIKAHAKANSAARVGPTKGSIIDLHTSNNNGTTTPTISTPKPVRPVPYGTFGNGGGITPKPNELLVPGTPRGSGGPQLDIVTPEPSPPPTAGGSIRRPPVPLTPALLPHTGVGSTGMLPSSNPRAKAEPRTLNPLRALKFALRDPLYTSITLIVFFSQLSEYGVFETEPLYLRMMLDFQRDDRSHVMVVVGMSTFAVMVVLMPWLLPRLKERRVIMIALFCNFLHVVLYAVIWEKSQVFIIALVGAAGYMSYPASSSLLSKNVSSKEQGAAQGALSGFKSLTQGFGPLLFSLIFSFFTSEDTPLYLPAAPFFLGAAFITVAFIVTCLLSDKVHNIGFHQKVVATDGSDDTQPLLSRQSDNASMKDIEASPTMTPSLPASLTTPTKTSIAGSSFVITLTPHGVNPPTTPTRGTIRRSQSHPITLGRTPTRDQQLTSVIPEESENEPQS